MGSLYSKPKIIYEDDVPYQSRKYFNILKPLVRTIHYQKKINNRDQIEQYGEAIIQKDVENFDHFMDGLLYASSVNKDGVPVMYYIVEAGNICICLLNVAKNHPVQKKVIDFMFRHKLNIRYLETYIRSEYDENAIGYCLKNHGESIPVGYRILFMLYIGSIDDAVNAATRSGHDIFSWLRYIAKFPIPDEIATKLTIRNIDSLTNNSNLSGSIADYTSDTDSYPSE